MKNTTILFIGMDTHKETTDVAYVEEGHDSQPHYLGKFPSNKRSMEKLLRQLQSKYPQATLYFTYEAGPVFSNPEMSLKREVVKPSFSVAHGVV